MKRLILSLLFVASATAAWAYDFKVQVRDYALYFNIIDADEHAVEVTAPLTEGNNRWAGEVPPAGILEIPGEVVWGEHTYNVVAIADRAFYGCSDITALSLPPSITDIGAYAFSLCTALKGEVTIGENVVSLGRSALSGVHRRLCLCFLQLHLRYADATCNDATCGQASLYTVSRS